jgi:hypothetical protein
MAVSADYTANLAADVVGLYQDAEQILLQRIARALAQDMDAPDWAERKLLQVQLLQQQTVRQLQELTGRSAQEVAAAVLKAYNRGQALAATDLAALAAGATGDPGGLPPGLPAVESLVTETVGAVQATHAGILRSVDDVFREVIARSAPQVLLGVQTRREAAQSALDQFAARGVTGFTDRAGRRWALESYVEMATRAGTANAAVDGHVARLAAGGHDLVIVSDAPQECKICRPWEGKVLSIAAVRRVDGPAVDTLAAARRDGLFHPGCRHSVSAYLPGVTKTPTRTADPEGDAARQRLRYLERQTRAAKRQVAVALDDTARAAAQARVRAYQSKIRAHVGSTAAKRQPGRERLGAL